MTRSDILTAYKVTELGCIVSPGQFEGEPIYAPYLWSLALEGMADEDDGDVFTFYIEKFDRDQFPELSFIHKVDVYQRADGFVCTEPVAR